VSEEDIELDEFRKILEMARETWEGDEFRDWFDSGEWTKYKSSKVTSLLFDFLDLESDPESIFYYGPAAFIELVESYEFSPSNRKRLADIFIVLSRLDGDWVMDSFQETNVEDWQRIISKLIIDLDGEVKTKLQEVELKLRAI